MLIRTGSAGATYAAAAACREAVCEFSLGFAVGEPVRDAIHALPETAWTADCDIDSEPVTVPGSPN